MNCQFPPKWIMSDIRQIYALIMKDITLQFRQWKSNFCQLCTPIVCMLFIFLLQIIVNEVVMPLIDTGDDSGRDIPSFPLDLNSMIGFQMAKNRTHYPSSIQYSVKDKSEREYMDRLNNKMEVPFGNDTMWVNGNLYSVDLSWYERDIDTLIFDALEDFKEDEDFVNPYYGSFKVSNFMNELKYTVQYEDMPRYDNRGRETPRTEFCLNMDKLAGGYCEFGSGVGLMDIIHAEHIKNATNGRMSVKTYTSQQPYFLEPFEFELNLAELMGNFIYPLILLLGIPTIMYSIVLEKETQLKEMMGLMGLKNRNYIIATYCFKFCWFFLSLILFIALGFMLQHRLFYQTNWLLLFFVFIGIGLQVVSVGFFCSSFIDSSFVATIIGYLLVLFVPLFGVFLIMFFVKPGEYALKFLLLFPTFPVVDIIYHMTNGCSKMLCLGLDAFTDNNDFIISFFFLYFDAIMFFLIGLYLERVAFKTWGVRKGYCFCLEWIPSILGDCCKFCYGESWIGKNVLYRKKKKKAWELKKSDKKFYREDEDEDVVEVRDEILKGNMNKRDLGILVNGLVKQFGRGKSKNIAVKKVCLGIKKDECFGLLGPNGAGKTTLIRMLSGIFAPSGGTAYVSGYDIRTDMDLLRQKIGLCPQFAIIWDALTPSEHLLFYSRLKGISPLEEEAHVGKILDGVGLRNPMKKFVEMQKRALKKSHPSEEIEEEIEEEVEEVEKDENSDHSEKENKLDIDIIDEEVDEKPISAGRIFCFSYLLRLFRMALPFEKTAKSLNGGMKRRLAIGISLCGDPDIILMDEPSTGLDNQVRREIWDVITKEKKNRCVVLTTHSMEEADVLSDRIGIMSHGRLVALGSSLHLKNKFGNGYTLHIKAEEEKNIKQIISFIEEKFNEICELQLIQKFGEKLTYQLLPLSEKEENDNEKEKEENDEDEKTEEEKDEVENQESLAEEIVDIENTEEPQEDNNNNNNNNNSEDEEEEEKDLVSETSMPKEEKIKDGDDDDDSKNEKKKGVLRISEVFEKLEREKSNLGIVDFELNQTTLEDVFLNVVRYDEEKIISERQQKTNWEELGFHNSTKNKKKEEEIIEDKEEDKEKNVEKVNESSTSEGSGSTEEEKEDDPSSENNEGGQEIENSESSSDSSESEDEDEDEDEKEKEKEKEENNNNNSEEEEEDDDDDEKSGEIRLEESRDDSETEEESSNEEEKENKEKEGEGELKKKKKIIEEDDDNTEKDEIEERKFNEGIFGNSCIGRCFGGIIDFFFQTIFLMQKNCILACRGWKSSCLQIVSPFVMVVVIFVMMNIIEADREEWFIHPERYEIKTNELLECTTWDTDDCYLFAYTTNSNPFGEEIMQEIVREYDLEEGEEYLQFPKTSDLESFLSENENMTQTGISFTNSTVDYKTGENVTTYTLYFNGTKDMENYVINYKLIIDNTIIKLMNRKEGIDENMFKIHASKESFPRIPDRKNTSGQKVIFQYTGPMFFSLLASIIFIVSLYKVVMEKEKGLREGLQMIGMKKSSYVCSWICDFVFFGVLMTLVSMISGYIFVFDVFVYCNPVFMFLLFFFFIGSLIMLAFAISTMISKTKSALVIGFVILAISFILNMYIASGSFVYLLLSLKNEEGVVKLIPYGFQLFYPPFNFGKVFSDYLEKTMKIYDPDINGFKANEGFWSVSQLFEETEVRSMSMEFSIEPPIISLMFLVWNCAIFFAGFWYLDAILWDGKSICFCCNPLYYCGCLLDFSCCKKIQKNRTVGRGMMKLSKEELKGMDEDLLEEYKDSRDPDDSLPIRILGLKKFFRPFLGLGKTTKAVKGVDLSCKKYQCLGLLGPNAAGKSSIIGSVAGVLRKSKGEIFVDGLSSKHDRARIRPRLGVTLQHNVLFDELTAKEHIRLVMQMKGYYNPMSWKKEIKERLTEVSLFDVRNDRSKTFSGGMKRRLSVAIGYVGNPSVILLDEPSTGLDPFSKREVWKLVKDKCINKQNSLLLTTHSMEEADTLSNKIAIMKDGKVKAIGDSMYLKKKYGAGFFLKITCVSEEKEKKFVEWIKKLFPNASSFQKRNSCSYMLNLYSKYTDELIHGLKRIEDNMYGEFVESKFQNNNGNFKKEGVNYDRNIMADFQNVETLSDFSEGSENQMVNSYEDFYEVNERLVKNFGLSNTTLEDVYLEVTKEDEKKENDGERDGEMDEQKELMEFHNKDMKSEEVDEEENVEVDGFDNDLDIEIDENPEEESNDDGDESREDENEENLEDV